MIKTLHIAAQYLTAAAITFVEKKDDDSHTNLDWSNENATLSSRPLNSGGDVLALNLTSFSLEWRNYDQLMSSFNLAGEKHQTVLLWIKEQLEKAGGQKPYMYEFHYDIGYGINMTDYIFPQPDIKELNRIAELLSIAQNAMTSVLNEQSLNSEIRVWSHHFDIGAFAVVSEKVSLGFGLAIPDSMMDDFYYYISGYQSEDYLETKNFEQLKIGEWKTESWKAGTLKATGISEQQAQQFLNETINAYREKYA